MAITKTDIRRGAYYDSIILMQLQATLAQLPNINNVGVMMGTPANKALLTQTNLLTEEAQSANPDDLIIAVQGDDDMALEEALKQVEGLLNRRKSSVGEVEYLPQSVEAASKMLPQAQWLLVSVPGRYAAGVAREGIRLHKHVFLYSDNVPLEEEINLKQEAAEKGLLVMGPDCGTAIIHGVGLGFANKVRRGSIGVVGASGTGLQQVTARIHQLGGGITHALGTGGRDLSEAVGARTAQQSLDVLRREPNTAVIVLISKPPAQAVADNLLRLARTAGKPVVVNFIGYSPTTPMPNVHFARTLDQTAALAVQLAQDTPPPIAQKALQEGNSLYLRGLFSGGTLAYEALLILQEYLPVVYSNAPLDKQFKLPDSLHSHQHTIVDLGEDEFTVGRLHPMMDNSLRLQRLHQEAADPQVALIMLDVVLGYGAHPDPASELAPAIAAVISMAKKAGRALEVVVILCGTDEDPQDMAVQMERLQQAGARVETNNETAVRYVGQQLAGRSNNMVEVSALTAPLAAINVGLETFTTSLQHQQADVVHVNWRPPAGGNPKLMSILERMKRK